MRVGVGPHPCLDLVEGAGARQVHLERVRAEPRMVVRVDEPGQHRGARGIDHLGVGALGCVGVIAHPRDPPLAHRDRLRPGARGIDRERPGVADQEVGRSVGHRAPVGRGNKPARSTTARTASS